MKKVALKLCIMAGIFVVGFVGFSYDAEALKITNNSINKKHDVSVSTWGAGGNQSIYTILPNHTENWSRSDEDGVLTVNHTINKTYFLKSSDHAYIDYKNGEYVLTTYYGSLFALPVNTNVPEGTNGNIKVKNNYGSDIYVAVNKWGSGNGSYFKIKNNSTESWSRKDKRGYLVAVKKGKTKHHYYVKSGTELIIDRNGFASIGGKRVEPISMRGGL
ncbi:hypothetical protein ABXL60_11245 [Enterococcus faecalis]|uniref:hypothetical protein n=1 Tax=Enterococcus faecalis TaxID=1351 RepID=UPI00338EB144